MTLPREQRDPYVVKETVRTQEMFEHYYSQGFGRKLKHTAEAFKVTENRMHVISCKLEWAERIAARDAIHVAKIQAQGDEDVAITKRKYRKVVASALAKFVKELQAGNVEVKTVKDFALLVRLDMYLAGDMTAIKPDAPTTEINVLNINTNWQEYARANGIDLNEVIEEARRIAIGTR